MKIKEVISFLETIAPPNYQESYDNSGLLTGNRDTEISKILISLDMTEAIVEEAIQKGCNLVIAHHPIIFKGLKRLTGSNYVERTVIKAIQNNIALYAIHTNLDSVNTGVNKRIGEKLGLSNLQILVPKPQTLKKLVTFIPNEQTEKVAEALFNAGAGKIGNYSNCSFTVNGTGNFKPNEFANPTIGSVNKAEQVEETRLELLLPAYLERQVVRALQAAHPYEEPAYDIISLDNVNKEVGSGMIGDLPEAVSEIDFLQSVKKNLNVPLIRHTALRNKLVKRVALCGGSGSFLLRDAIAQNADVYVSCDFKYHEFFDAEYQLVIADIGHYEAEVHTKELIYELLIKNFSNIAVILAKTVTNPISYL